MGVIQAEGISKIYSRGLFTKGLQALNNLSIDIEKGEVFGFLGPNGAGKTTFLKVMLNIIYPTTGHATIDGIDVRNPHARRSVGYLPENPYFYDRLNGYQILDFYGRIYKMPIRKIEERSKEVLALVGLEQAAKRPLRSYSKGMLQRIGLAQAILSSPEIVFLDEPSTGLDPMGRRKIKDIILNLKQNGTTVFLNSHILADVEDTCDRVGIVKDGSLVKVARVEDLTIDVHRLVIKLRIAHESFSEKLSDLISRFKIINDTDIELAIDSPERTPQIIHRLVSIGAEIFEVRYYTTSLEDIFINIIANRGNN